MADDRSSSCATQDRERPRQTFALKTPRCASALESRATRRTRCYCREPASIRTVTRLGTHPGSVPSTRRRCGAVRLAALTSARAASGRSDAVTPSGHHACRHQRVRGRAVDADAVGAAPSRRRGPARDTRDEAGQHVAGSRGGQRAAAAGVSPTSVGCASTLPAPFTTTCAWNSPQSACAARASRLDDRVSDASMRAASAGWRCGTSGRCGPAARRAEAAAPRSVERVGVRSQSARRG